MSECWGINGRVEASVALAHAPALAPLRPLVSVSCAHAHHFIPADSAGLRSTSDPIEAEGIRRAQASAQQADVLVWVQDAVQLLGRGLMEAGLKQQLALMAEARRIAAAGEAAAAAAEAGGKAVAERGMPLQPLLLMLNKSDLLRPQMVGELEARAEAAAVAALQQGVHAPVTGGPAGDSSARGGSTNEDSSNSASSSTSDGGSGRATGGGEPSAPPLPPPAAQPPLPVRVLSASCKTGQGLPELVSCLEGAVSELMAAPAVTGGLGGHMPLISRQRHRQLVESCVECLDHCLEVRRGAGFHSG